MYENTDLVDLGKVTSVVLGLTRWGDDPDGSSFLTVHEFAEGLPVAPSLLADLSA